MRKLNGITINGEFLGSGVVINGMFRAICAISPVIMREFVCIINKIDALDEAVRISNFNCDNAENSMDIEFENNTQKGVVSLYFELLDGEPELTDCKLIFDDKEYSTLDNNAYTTPEINDITPSSLEEEKRKRLQALKESKLEKLRNKQSDSVNSKTHEIPISGKPDNQQLSKKEQKMQELLERKRKALENKGSSKSESIPEDGSGLEENKINTQDVSIVDANESEKNKDSLSGSVKNQSLEENNNPDSNDVMSTSSGNSEESKIAKLSLEDFTEEELENLSLEELEQLERELAQDEPVYEYPVNNTYGSHVDTPSSTIDIAEKISHGIAEGITQGLTQGLVQGLSEGLSQGLSQGLQGYNRPSNFTPEDNFSYNNNSWENAPPQQSYQNPEEGYDFKNDSNSGGFDFSNNESFDTAPQGGDTYDNNYSADFYDIDTKNKNESILAHNVYSYDENSNIEELSDFYSDFYDIQANGGSQNSSGLSVTSEHDETIEDELERLKAELAAFQNNDSEETKMTLDEYMARRKEIEEAKEKIRRKKIRIVGSRGRVSAKALEDGVYVSGSKIYKWGDVRYLDG